MLVKNPIEYAQNLDKFFRGEQVKCPKCKKGILNHKFYANPKSRVGCAQFSCSSCNTEAHLSRVVFPKDVEFEEL